MKTRARQLKRPASSAANVLGPSAEERMRAGKALRKKVPRSSHAAWTPPAQRPDPIELLKKADGGRLAELLPIRYARMKQCAFAFLRGAAAVMAWDLAHTPATGLRVQAGGDCHAANFGGFGSPERRLLFDLTDFDETLPAPWEWDVKRLTASIVVAGRDSGIGERHCGEAARAAAESYRERMREYAGMRALEVWYSHLDADILIEKAKNLSSRERWKKIEDKARNDTSEHLFPQITQVVGGQTRIVDHQPLVYHPPHTVKLDSEVRDIFHRYRLSLPEERRVILDRYHVVDVARKVVGVGSVGTRCAVALLMAGEHDPLLLQFKEARASVLEPYAGKSRYANHGERVVTGQRMLQAASDVFLGWTRDDHRRDYYFRQLRDMKMTLALEKLTRADWMEYAAICGWTLARAHARTGDAARIAGYMGNGTAFERAIGGFAVAYADQTERDYRAFVKAIQKGRLPAKSE
jgi:uncharacterized protein (DUF2252 family)